MKVKHRLEQLKKQFDRMRKDSVAAVGTANEAVYSALATFADKELKALHDYYDEALAALRSQKKDHSGIKAVLQTQFDLMQETVTRLIANARESVDTATTAAPAPVVTPAKAAPKKAAVKKAPAKKAAPKAAPVEKKAAAKKVAKKAVVKAAVKPAVKTAKAPKKAAKKVAAEAAPAPKPKRAKKVKAAPSAPEAATTTTEA